MPEIGRPTTAQEQQYRQVTMAPKEVSNDEIIRRATGTKPKGIHSDKPHNQMGKDEFLKLLTYQLQNQDPMNPMEQSKMTGELAQFSQLEQLSNLNGKFDKIQQNQGIQDKFYAASFVGKRVVTTGSSIKLTQEGESADVLFKLEGPADKVVIRLMDEKNQVVGEMWREGLSAGGHQIQWDGVSMDGTLAAKGNYKAVVKAWQANGMEVPARTEATGIVSSVSFDEGEPVLSVDNQKVYLRDVTSFHEADGSQGRMRPMGQATNEAMAAAKAMAPAFAPAPQAKMQNMPTAQHQDVRLRLNQASPNPAQAVNAYKGTDAGIYD
jgi:flagellar basal-body rod modification protein FlgD